MPEHTAITPRAARIRDALLEAFFSVPFAALLAMGLLAFGATNVFAKEYEVVNTPPPMPEAMQNPARVTPVTPRGAVPVVTERTVRVNGEKTRVREAVSGDMGFAVPDANGDLIWVPAPAKAIPPGQADARELRLKVRELASQLIAVMDPSLKGTVAIPTSFVNQEDFSQSSPLGRFIAEQLIFECNQRGFPVREYRLAPAVTVQEDGEFLLTRKSGNVPTQTRDAVFVVGTYFIDKQAVFVNARLVQGNGTVLRTAQVILPGNGITRRMLAGSGRNLKTGTLPIHDYKTTTQPVNLTPFDQGEDVH